MASEYSWQPHQESQALSLMVAAVVAISIAAVPPSMGKLISSGLMPHPGVEGFSGKRISTPRG